MKSAEELHSQDFSVSADTYLHIFFAFNFDVEREPLAF